MQNTQFLLRRKISALLTNYQEISEENELQIISCNWNTEIPATIGITNLAI